MTTKEKEITEGGTKETSLALQDEAIVVLLKQFPTPVLKSVLNLVQFHAGLIEDTRRELVDAFSGLEQAELNKAAAEEVGIRELVQREIRVIKRVRKDIIYLENKVSALENGFLQMPRFDATRIEWSSERIPYSTLKRLKEAKELGVFDEFGVVNDKYTTGRQKRDPFLVGILQGGYGREEHFFIGAWK